MAVGCFAVFFRTLKQRAAEDQGGQSGIHWRERRAFRGYFLQILRHFSRHYAVIDVDRDVPFLALLESTLWRFAAGILEVAVRLHSTGRHGSDQGLSYLEPERVRTSLERDLGTFWPGRQSQSARKPLRLPTVEEANDPGMFIDLDGLTAVKRWEAPPPPVDWSQFGISPPETDR